MRDFRQLLEYHLLLTHDLQLVTDADYDRLSGEVIEVKRMLTSFVQKIRVTR
jgi:hypothetical protein